MITKRYNSCYINYKKIHGYDCKFYSKNDLPSFVVRKSYTKITFVVWNNNGKHHRDNDLPDHINIFRFIANFTFSKYELYYRYNGYGYVNQYNKNGNISKTENYKFIKVICYELLKKEFDNK